MGVRRLAFARAILVRGDLQRGNAYEKVLVAIMEGEGSLPLVVLYLPLGCQHLLPCGAAALGSVWVVG